MTRWSRLQRPRSSCWTPSPQRTHRLAAPPDRRRILPLRRREYHPGSQRVARGAAMTFVSGVVELARWWWTFILRGVLAIAFGILAFFAPGLGIAVLVGLFAAWALIDGATN